MKRLAILTCMVAIAVSQPVWGQAATQPAAPAAPQNQSAPIADPMQARVLKVSGQVQYALIETAGGGNIGVWQDAKVGDTLPAGTRIRTRLRSQVVLAFGDDSVVLIDRATLASIDQFHRSGDTKHVRLGLGHGAIRAGVAETTLRSDMTIETPTATLSKKGTIDFGIEYEPSTGRFRIFLAREGLVEALNKLTQERRYVLPGQYATQAMVRWITTATFDRHVAMADLFGMNGNEKMFNALHSSGLGVVEPGGGNVAGNFGPRVGSQQGTGPFVRTSPILPIQPGAGAINRPEGNFGTGGAVIPRIFGNK